MNGTDASPAIKRAARTYGKPRKAEPEPEQDYDDVHDTSFATSSNGDASHDSIPQSPGDSLPPDSSDNEPLLDSSMVRDDEGEFVFGWKKRLQAIDNEDDLEGAPPPGELALKLTQIDREETSRSTLAGPLDLFEPERISSPFETRRTLATDDMSSISPTSSPDAGPSKARPRKYKSVAFSPKTQPADEPDKREDVTTSGRSHARSPSPLTRRVRRRRTIFDSDSSSESGAAEDKGRRARVRARATGRETSASAETSPDKLHHINSPPARPSQTPPSSQEMPPKRPIVVDSFVPPPRFVGKAPTAKDKGKKKDNAVRERELDNQADAESDGEPGSPGEGGSRGQDRRKKKLSKKEQLEVEKATARLKAEQSAQLKATTKPLKVTAMLGTIKPEASSPKVKSSPITPLPPQNQYKKVQQNKLHMEKIPNPRRRPIERSALGASTASTSRTGSTGLGSGRSTTAERSRTTTPAGFDDADNPLYTPDERTVPAARRKSALPTPSFENDPSHADDNSSEDELPSTADILEEDQRKRSDAERKRELDKVKAAALEKVAREKSTRHEPDSDGSELEIVADDAHERVREETRARQTFKPRESQGRRLQRTYARVKNPATARGDSGQADDPFARHESRMRHMREASFSGFVTRTNTGPKPSRDGKSRAGVNARDLNRALLQSASEQSRKITRQKEYEFYRGERNALPGDQWREAVQREAETEARKKQALTQYVDRAIENAAKREAGQDYEEDDEEDGEYVPEQEEDDEDEDPVSGEEPDATDGPGEHEDDTDENDENDENLLPAPHRHTGPSRVIVDSDEEDDQARRPPPARVADQGRILVPNSSQPNSSQPSIGAEDEDEDAQMPDFEHRPSVSSAEDTDRLEEGTDKENNELLKFDCGEDKENTVISQQPSSPSDIGFRLLRRGPSAGILSPDVRSREGNRPAGVRSPLQEIPREDEDDEDDFFGPPKPNLVGFSSSPQRPSRNTSPKPLRGFATPRPMSLGGDLDGFFGDGFSAPAAKAGANPFQTPGAGSSSLEPAAVILPGSGGLGFSQFDDEKPQGNIFAAQKGRPERGFSQFATPDGQVGKLSKLRQPALGTMVLSMAEQRAQLTLDEQLLDEADQIFEKQQEAVVGAALVPDSSKAQKMYINNHGFYTQNKPDSARKETPWAKRAPLAPLPVEVTPFVLPGDDEDEMPQSEMPARGRIMKRAVTPEDGSGRDSSPSLSPQNKGKGRARNAFDMLGGKPLKALPLHKPKKKLDKSEFIEGEAVESDEEHVFGFGPSKKDDDEEADGEDQDGVLQELMDDATMDADTLNEDAVMEKVKEHQAADDAQAHKRAVDATEGRLRRRRRERGLLNSDDSDDDDSDDDDLSAKRRREKMRKKRKIDGDTLDDLEKHAETQAFAQAYRADLEDDNDEFSYMQEDDFTSLPLGNDEADMDEDEDEDDDEPRERVSAAALREELQDAIRNRDTRAIPTIDPEDISWVDNDDMDVMDEDVQIKEITTTKNAPRGGQTHGMEMWEMARTSRGGSAQDVAREQRWARSEGGSRNAGTGRGSAAVTSLVQSKSSSSSKTGVKAGGGSITGRRLGKAAEAPQPQAGPSTRRAAPLGKTQSALSSSALSRRGKFAK